MKTTKFLSLFLFAALTLSSCSDDNEDIIIKPSEGKTSGDVTNDNKNTSGPSEAQYRIEFPKLKGENTVVVVHKAILNKNSKEEGINYCVEWDYSIRTQHWSCYQLYSSINYHKDYNVSRYYSDNDGSLSSTCQYPNDPDLPSQYRLTEDPYKYSGYDHGHICPSADRQRATECNYQTFYITNMQPQTKVFNGSDKNTPAEHSPWFRIEDRTRTWAGKFDTLYVCKGGVIGNSTKTIGSGSNKIPVPSYFFVALLGKKGSTYKAIGFWMEHVGSYTEKKPLSNYAVNIDQLERLTDFDFFCNLPDETENAVEKSYKASDWDNLQ